MYFFCTAILSSGVLKCPLTYCYTISDIQEVLNIRLHCVATDEAVYGCRALRALVLCSIWLSLQQPDRRAAKCLISMQLHPPQSIALLCVSSILLFVYILCNYITIIDVWYALYDDVLRQVISYVDSLLYLIL